MKIDQENTNLDLLASQKTSPRGVTLEPLQIQALFEEFKLQAKMQDQQNFQEFELEAKQMDIQIEQTEPEQEQQPETAKRSYRQFCEGAYGREYKIISSFNFMVRKPCKRISV